MVSDVRVNTDQSRELKWDDIIDFPIGTAFWCRQEKSDRCGPYDYVGFLCVDDDEKLRIVYFETTQYEGLPQPAHERFGVISDRTECMTFELIPAGSIIQFIA